jgi:hypothetical protein
MLMYPNRHIHHRGIDILPLWISLKDTLNILDLFHNRMQIKFNIQVNFQQKNFQKNKNIVWEWSNQIKTFIIINIIKYYKMTSHTFQIIL